MISGRHGGVAWPDAKFDLVVGNVYEEVDVFELISLVKGDAILGLSPFFVCRGGIN